MILNLKSPAYGYGINSLTVTRLLKTPGEAIALDEALYEVETTKATNEVESSFAGRLVRWYVTEGEVIPIGYTVAEIEVDPIGTLPVESVASPIAEEVRISSTVQANIAVEVKWRAVELALELTRNNPIEERLTTAIILSDCVRKTLLQHRKFCHIVQLNGQFSIPNKIGVGIAVARADDDLAIAVVENALDLPFQDFMRMTREAIARARSGTTSALGDVPLLISDMSLFGVRNAVPIVVEPAIATLFLGEAYFQTMPDIGAKESGRAAILSLSFNHRLINGVGAARFLNDLRLKLETYSLPIPISGSVQPAAPRLPEQGLFNGSRPLAVSALKRLPLADRQMALQDHLCEVAALLFGMAKSALDPDRPLKTLPLDSLVIIELEAVATEFASLLGQTYSISFADLSISETSIAQLAEYVMQQISAAEP